MKTQNEFGKILDFEKENISNIVCPICEKKITAKSFEGLNCENCGANLEIEITKEKGRIFIKLPQEVFGHHLPLLKIKRKGVDKNE